MPENVLFNAAARVAIIAAVCAVAVGPIALMAADNPPTPVLVELFTSEGCSSCPPADALLRTLDSTQPIPGAQLIVLSEHVDYWDELGWRDPFSSHQFTQRQAAYADRLRLATSYTPQMVVDGDAQFVGSDRTRAAQAMEKARGTAKINLRISNIAIENGKLRAHVETDAVPEKAELFVALVLNHAQSQVLRGENGGHRLEHVAVVRNLTSAGNVAKGASFAKDVTLTVGPSTEQHRLIAFLQEPNQGKILGAAQVRVQK